MNTAPETEIDTQTPAGDAPAKFLTFRLARVQAKLNAQSSRILKDHAGITLTQWRLLSLIGGAGRTTAAHLSREVAMDKGLISRNIKTLVTDGFVQVTLDPEDHRAQHLELTPHGLRVFQDTLPRMRARQDALRAHLDIEEELILDRALEKLERAAEDRALG
ncbi:MAG: MarR family winged helix-turn-helix transcriptional regulator [Sagittula sp.]|jgi:DNA-binding MarR family transcriptional regulator|uniref:MarR family winged helix-turn-helix transcriptional regulator n=1 Tax=unclassified Sagittula TaxID=2624628 RepID=UPI0012FD73BC|nr:MULTISPECIES: MarR family winged helix-turn-helix transcriptional regulator [unclassified Sagittula]WHZ36064.1 MarR family winged helix-turn-helix transcriptional regulator [Sagittula sp. MA-2]